MTNKKIFAFDKKDFFISKILLQKIENVISFYGYSIKKIFWTNDNYLYTATLNENTFEFSNWGFTK